MRILVLGEQSCFSSALHAAATERGITIEPVHSTKMLEQKLQTEEFDCALLLQEPTTSLLNWLSTRPNLLSLLPTMLRCDPRHAPESPQSYGILRVVWIDYTWEEVFEQAHQMHQQFHASETLYVAGIHLDKRKQRACFNTTEISVTDTEFEILWLLAENYKKVISTTRILSTVWGLQHDPQSNRVAVYMKRIRQKLPKDNLIHSVRSVGYVLDDTRD